MNIEQANNIPLAQILDKINAKLKRTSQNDHVNTAKNLWFDHGIGEGGDVITFVCKYLQSCDVDYTVSDALRWIRNMFGYAPIIMPVKDLAVSQDDRKLVVTNIREIKRPPLIRYLSERGIPLEIAMQYYKEVDVYHKEKKKSIYALGMKNEKGGYELLNKYYKGSAGPKDITFIRGTRPKPEGIHLFEGGLDFVSALIRTNKGERFENDTIVLHSLSNLKKATPYIKGYGYLTAFTWMDNDDPGKAATTSLDNFFKTEEMLLHKPLNRLYTGHKDVSAWHMHKLGLSQ